MVARSELVGHLQESFVRFRAERIAAKRARLSTVLTVGFIFLVLGDVIMAFLFVAVGLFRDNWSGGSVNGWIAAVAAYFLASACVIISSCPEEDVNINEYVDTSTTLRIAFKVISVTFAFISGYVFKQNLHEEDDLSRPILAIAILLVAPGMTVYRSIHGEAKGPYPTTTCSIWILLIHITFALNDVHHMSEDCGRGKLVLYIARVVGCTSFAVYALWKIKVSRCTGWSPTGGLYRTVDFQFLLWGASILGEAAFAPMCPCTYLFESLGSAGELIAIGLGFMAPVFAIYSVGRNRTFCYLAEHIFFGSDNKRQLDGAFMASLLDGIGAAKGDDWWIHHGRNLKLYLPGDPRRNWSRGKIVEVSDAAFVVETCASYTKSFSPSQPGTVVQKTSSTNSIDTATTGSSSRGFGKSLSFATSNSFQHHRIARSNYGLTTEALLELASKELKCIDWENITLALMKESKGSPETQALARPLGESEKIDYFMSHSWHDDPDLKYAMLQEIAEAFKLKHRRYPTFWLDKVCIDQARISDGLKALPVNVMACRKVLVLCSGTYPHRLWCVWELYTLFSFAEEEEAVRRVKFVPFGGDGGCGVVKELAEFSVKNAHCYDPNEENKLHAVIKATGRKNFNTKIRRMAQAIIRVSATNIIQSNVIGICNDVATMCFRRNNMISSAQSIDDPLRDVSGISAVTYGGTESMPAVCAVTSVAKVEPDLQAQDEIVEDSPLSGEDDGSTYVWI